MTDFHYLSGDGIGIAGPGLALVSDASATAVMDDLWRLAQRLDLDAMEVLTALGAGGLGGLPDFAFVLLRPAARLLVRGRFDVEITSGTQTLTTSAQDVTTWAEQRLPEDTTGVLLRSTDAVEGDGWLPLGSGVVRTTALRVVVGVGDVSTGPIDAPVADQAPPARRDASVMTSPDPKIEREPVPTAVVEVIETDREPSVVVEQESADDVPRSRDTLADPVEDAYDELFGASVARLPEDAAVRPLDEEDEFVAPSDPGIVDGTKSADEDSGEHDGMTIAGRSRRDLLGSRPTTTAVEHGQSAGVIATLVVSDGRVVLVDRSVYVGRAPEALTASIDDLPQLVSVVSRESVISRTHVEFRREGDDVLVRDVSTNGTVLVRPGRAPERLAPKRDTLLTDGSLIRLSDDVEITLSIVRGE